MKVRKHWICVTLVGFAVLLGSPKSIAEEPKDPGTQAVLVSAGPQPQEGQQGSKIIWAKSLKAAMKESRRTGKPVITYFTYDT